MDESRFALPVWLPWATTACLAALVACLGELWIIEKMRAQLAHDEVALAESALKAAENQLEAERILDRGERESLRMAAPAGSGPRVALLLPPVGAPPPAEGPAWGAVAWDPAGTRGELRIAPSPPAGAGYELWLERPDGAEDCGAVAVASAPSPTGLAIQLARPVAAGSRFLLIEGRKGASRTLDEAKAAGPIVLATLPIEGNISKNR